MSTAPMTLKLPAFVQALPARSQTSVFGCNSALNVNSVAIKSRTLAPKSSRARLVMTSSPPPPSSDQDNTKETTNKPVKENDDDQQVSFWGVTSFAIIFIIFAIGIVATLARDFIPGGVTAPAPPVQ